MKDYSKMSDFEICELVAQFVLWKKRDCEEIHADSDRKIVSWADGANWHDFDPCNNPSGAWPTILENKIAVLPWNGSEWQAFLSLGGADGVRFRTMHKNPLRCAMIVYLMMKDEEK